MADNYVKHTDLVDEQIAKIKTLLMANFVNDPFWVKLARKEAWTSGSDTMKVRKLQLPPVVAKDLVGLTEGVAPDSKTMTYMTFSRKVYNLGTNIPYTKESVQFNFDDVVRDAGDQLGYHAHEVVEESIAAAYCKSAATLTFGASWAATIRKARTVLLKNKAKQYNGSNYLMVINAEDNEALLAELGDACHYTSEKDAVLKGYIGSYGGFDIVIDPTNSLSKSDTVQYALFIGKNPLGQLPVVVNELKDIEIIHKPLGSGVIQDSTGKTVTDANNRIGYVAYNIDGFGAYVEYDECVLVTEVTLGTTPASEVVTDPTKRTGYLSKSTSPVIA